MDLGELIKFCLVICDSEVNIDLSCGLMLCFVSDSVSLNEKLKQFDDIVYYGCFLY